MYTLSVIRETKAYEMVIQKPHVFGTEQDLEMPDLELFLMYKWMHKEYVKRFPNEIRGLRPM